MQKPIKLSLIRGVPSSASLGNTAITNVPPTTLDLLTGVFTIYDEAAESSFQYSLANIKDGGVWVDSVAMPGRQLVAGDVANVIETIQLNAVGGSTVIDRARALRALMNFAASARLFWTDESRFDPVYLCWQAPGAAGEQFALLYNIEVDAEADALNAESMAALTLTLEREAYWRPLPPGANPKIRTLQLRGLTPSTVAGSPAASQYNFENLGLGAIVGGSAKNEAQFQKEVFDADEIGSTRTNYIDIPASALVGDAPVAAMISVQSGSGDISYPIMVARSTIRDLYPSVTTNANLQRMRNTFNAVDAAAQSAPAGVSAYTTPVDATWGLTSGGGSPTVIQAVTINGVVANQVFAYWSRVAAHYARRWQVFVRCVVTAGVPSGLLMQARIRSASGVGVTYFPTVQRPFTGALNVGTTFYLGTIDASALNTPGNNGRGLQSTALAQLELLIQKTNTGASTTVKITDVFLMPLDEPMLKIDNRTTGGFDDDVFADTTGYFSLTDVLAGAVGDLAAKPVASGQSIYLVPGITNRLYFNAGIYGTSPLASHLGYYVGVNLLPRWSGIRDEV